MFTPNVFMDFLYSHIKNVGYGYLISLLVIVLNIPYIIRRVHEIHELREYAEPLLKFQDNFEVDDDTENNKKKKLRN